MNGKAGSQNKTTLIYLSLNVSYELKVKFSPVQRDFAWLLHHLSQWDLLRSALDSTEVHIRTEFTLRP